MTKTFKLYVASVNGDYLTILEDVYRAVYTKLVYLGFETLTESDCSLLRLVQTSTLPEFIAFRRGIEETVQTEFKELSETELMKKTNDLSLLYLQISA